MLHGSLTFLTSPIELFAGAMAVLEPGTIIAACLLLLPFAACAIRSQFWRKGTHRPGKVATKWAADKLARLEDDSQPPAAVEGWAEKQEVAEHFEISPRAVDNRMKRGFLPHIRVGKHVGFRLNAANEPLNRRHKRQGMWRTYAKIP
jgi:hypothetical protein